MSQPPSSDLLSRKLLTPGERLGWLFHHRHGARQPFGEPAPQAPSAPIPAVAPAAPIGRRLAVTAVLGGGGAILLGCCGFVAAGPGGSPLGGMLIQTAVLLLLGTGLLVGWLLWQHQRDKNGSGAGGGREHKRYQQAVLAWQARAAAFDQAEAARVGGLPQWVAAAPQHGSRLDIVGGTLWGWEALLTVAGASQLATHGPVVVLDLTGEAVCRDLAGVCLENQFEVDLQVLPVDGRDSDLLAGLDSRQLIEVLVESIHGDGDRMVRAERTMDDRILTAIVFALDGRVSMGRIVEALHVLMGHPGQARYLDPVERAHIGEELFAADYVRDAAGALRRLEAHLFPLREFGGLLHQTVPLTCMALATDGTSAHSELLADLMLAWVSRRIATAPGSCRTLIVAGADGLPGSHVARLSDLCSRRGIRLMLMWRHLRDNALRQLGVGAVGFMRLPGFDEATAAADHIGREHRFVLSGTTTSQGGSHTRTDSTGTADAHSSGASRGMTRSGPLAELIRTAKHWSAAETDTWSHTVTTNTSTAAAAGSNWSQTSSSSRVYEHTVDPGVLQTLPDTALLLIEPHQGAKTIRALDCNPLIATHPAVAMDPAGAPIPMPRPAPAVEHHPPAATWPSAGQPAPVHAAPPAAVPVVSPIPVRRSEMWSPEEDRR